MFDLLPLYKLTKPFKDIKLISFLDYIAMMYLMPHNYKPNCPNRNGTVTCCT